MPQIPLTYRFRENLKAGGYRRREETLIGFRLIQFTTPQKIGDLARSFGASASYNKRKLGTVWRYPGKPPVVIQRDGFTTVQGAATGQHTQAALRAAYILIQNGLARGRRMKRDLERVIKT